jgi:hypothetical protein
LKTLILKEQKVNQLKDGIGEENKKLRIIKDLEI